jgi:D-apiose dehydrogenase
VHENFRYQPPIAAVKEELSRGALGAPRHAHLQLKSPDRGTMGKQPALTKMDHMVLRDMGPHIFDVASYLFGDVKSILTLPVVSYPDIGVQDSALSLLRMASGLPLHCSLVHHFPYKLWVECQDGTLMLDGDNVLHVEQDGARRTVDTRTWPVLPYIPAEDWRLHGGHVFAAIPRCLDALMRSFLAGEPAETSGQNNLQTMRTVFAAIRSADEGRVVELAELQEGDGE